MKKRYAILSAVAGLIGGYVIAAIPQRDEIAQPGGEYFSIPDEGLRRLTYATKAATITAQRSRPGQFVVQATFADGRPAQRCITSADLAGKLHAFTHPITKRGLTVEQLDREFPVLHGVLDLRSELSPEPGGSVLVYTDKEGKSAAVVSYGSAAVLTIPLDAFKKLEAGCLELAALARPAP